MRILWLFPIVAILSTCISSTDALSDCERESDCEPTATTSLAPSEESGSSTSDEHSVTSLLFPWDLPVNIQPPPVPPNNPQTIEKVELGRFLFFDRNLSLERNRSCGICHEPAKNFSDGFPKAIGTTGDLHTRNTQGLVNIGYRSPLTWDRPDLTLIETQLSIPFFGTHPHELGWKDKEQELLDRVRFNPEYRGRFEAAFPESMEPLSFENMAKAIASFCRTIHGFNSPYDRYLRGELQNIDAAVLRGKSLFFSDALACFVCHSGINFDMPFGMLELDPPFFNIGLYNIDNLGTYPADSVGLIARTNRPEDMGKFRTPTLRNLPNTEPYMHDGSVPDLATVIDIFAAGGRQIVSNGPNKGDGRNNPFKHPLISGFNISESEKSDLIQFLMALNDEGMLTKPNLQDPWPREDESY